MRHPSAVRLAVAAAAVHSLSLGLGSAARAAEVDYLGQQIIATGASYAGTVVGGLSGIDRIAASGRYVAISDDRSALSPARYYELSLNLSQFVRSGSPGQAGVTFNAVTTILSPGGAAFGTNTVDPEGIRYNPASGTLLWSNEGQRVAGAFQNPTVREMTVGGTYVRDFAVPAKYLPAGSAGGETAGDTGIRNNLAFESLTVSTDGRTLYTATENALAQDGPAAAVGVGSPTRILSFDMASGAAGAEYLYNVGPVALPPNPAGSFVTNGLVDFVAVGDRQFIAMERSFSIGAATPGVGPNGLPTGYTVRLYRVDARGATDISGLAALGGNAVTAVTKTLLVDLSDLRNDDNTALALDNLEGITLGPVVDGRQTLVLVSDNNFGSTQFTQFVALSLANPVPEPAAWMLALPGLLLVLARRRRGTA